MSTSVQSWDVVEELSAPEVQAVENGIALGVLAQSAARDAPIGWRVESKTRSRTSPEKEVSGARYDPISADKAVARDPRTRERLDMMAEVLSSGRSGGGWTPQSIEYCTVMQPFLLCNEYASQLVLLRDGLGFMHNVQGGCETEMVFDFDPSSPWTAKAALECRRPGCLTRDCVRKVLLYRIFFPTVKYKDHKHCSCGRQPPEDYSNKERKLWRNRWTDRARTYATLIERIPPSWCEYTHCGSGVIITMMVMRLEDHAAPVTTIRPCRTIAASPKIAEAWVSGTDWNSTAHLGKKETEAAKEVAELRDGLIRDLRAGFLDLLGFGAKKGAGSWRWIAPEVGLDVPMLTTGVRKVAIETVVARSSPLDGRFRMDLHHRARFLVDAVNPVLLAASDEEGVRTVERTIVEKGGHFEFRNTEFTDVTEQDARPGRGRRADEALRESLEERCARAISDAVGVSVDDAKTMEWEHAQRRGMLERPFVALYRSTREKIKQNYDAAPDNVAFDDSLTEELEDDSLASQTQGTRRQAAALAAAEERAAARTKSAGRRVQTQSGHVFLMLLEQLLLVTLYGLGDVIMIDGTYRTNNLGWELWTVLVVDAAGRGVPVMHAWLEQSSALDYLEALGFYLSRATRTPRVVLMDMDLAQLLATTIAIPTCRVRFCAFHFMQAVVRKFRSKSHPMVDALRSLQHAPNMGVFQHRLRLLVSVLLLDESETEAWCSKPKTATGQATRRRQLARLAALVEDANADDEALVDEERPVDNERGSGGEEEELDEREEEEIGILYRNPEKGGARLAEALDEVRSRSFAQREIMLQYLIHILGTRKHWSRAWWEFMLFLTTTNHLESYHRVLKFDDFVGVHAVTLPGCIQAVANADERQLKHRRKECVTDLTYMGKLLLRHPKIDDDIKDMYVKLAREKGSFVGREYGGYRAIRGTSGMDGDVSRRLLCHPLVLAAMLNDAGRKHVEAIIGAVQRLDAGTTTVTPHVEQGDEATHTYVANDAYIVSLGPGAGLRMCTCPAFAERMVVCKHVIAAFEENARSRGLWCEDGSAESSWPWLEDAVELAGACLPSAYWEGRRVHLEYVMQERFEARKREEEVFLQETEPASSTASSASSSSTTTSTSTSATSSEQLNLHSPLWDWHSLPPAAHMQPPRSRSATRSRRSTLAPPLPPQPRHPTSMTRPPHRPRSPSTPTTKFLQVRPSRPAAPSREDRHATDALHRQFKELDRALKQFKPNLDDAGVGPVPKDLREDMHATLAKLVQVLNEASATYDRPVITDCTGTPSKSAARLRKDKWAGKAKKRGAVMRRTRGGFGKQKTSTVAPMDVEKTSAGGKALTPARERGAHRPKTVERHVKLPLSSLRAQPLTKPGKRKRGGKTGKTQRPAHSDDTTPSRRRKRAKTKK